MVKNLFREDSIKTLIDPLEHITCFMLLARQAFRKCRIVVVLLLIEYAIRMRIVMVLAPGTHARTHARTSARGHTPTHSLSAACRPTAPKVKPARARARTHARAHTQTHTDTHTHTHTGWGAQVAGGAA